MPTRPWCANSRLPAACSSARGARRASATMPAAPITFCPPAEARARAAASRPGISCAAPACSSSPAPGCRALRRSSSRWRRPKGLSRTAGRWRCAGEEEESPAPRAGDCRARDREAARAVRRAGRRPRRQAAPRFQRKHGRLLAGRAARAAAHDVRTTVHLSGVRSFAAAAGAPFWRAAFGDVVHQRRGRRAAPADGYLRRAGQHRAAARADFHDVPLLRRNRRRARRGRALRRRHAVSAGSDPARAAALPAPAVSGQPE